MCLHLAGTEPPKGPQICPSQTCSVTQKEEETPTTSLDAPGKEGSVTQGARSDSRSHRDRWHRGWSVLGGTGQGQC